MKIVDIATEIFEELAEPTDISIAAIAYWLRANVGKLNSAINTTFTVDPVTLEASMVDPTSDPSNPTYLNIEADEAAVFKLMYIVYYYDLQIRKNMLSYNATNAIEVSMDGHSVRLVSPTEIGKNLYMFRKDIGNDLKQWINWYRIAKAAPRQVAGDDTQEGPIESRPIYRRTYNLWN